MINWENIPHIDFDRPETKNQWCGSGVEKKDVFKLASLNSESSGWFALNNP